MGRSGSRFLFFYIFCCYFSFSSLAIKEREIHLAVHSRPASTQTTIIEYAEVATQTSPVIDPSATTQASPSLDLPVAQATPVLEEGLPMPPIPILPINVTSDEEICSISDSTLEVDGITTIEPEEGALAEATAEAVTTNLIPDEPLVRTDSASYYLYERFSYSRTRTYNDPYPGCG